VGRIININTLLVVLCSTVANATEAPGPIGEPVARLASLFDEALESESVSDAPLYLVPPAPATASPGLHGENENATEVSPGAGFAIQEGEAGQAAPAAADPSRTFGQEPTQQQEFPPPITFLRNQAVLLRRGEFQLDVGLVYSYDESDFAIASGAIVGEGQLRQRNIYVPLTARYGLTNNAQLQVAMPMGVSHSEFIGPGFDVHDNHGPIGDVTIALSYALPKWCPDDSDCVWTNSLVIPTGKTPSLRTTPDAGLGNGYFEYGSSMLLLQNYDPLLVFGSAGVRYGFETDLDGFDFERGLAFDYSLGVGFGVNEHISLSTVFQGSFETEVHLNGAAVPGSDRDLMSLRFALTKAGPCKIVEPFVSIGLTEPTAEAQLGIIWTYK